MFVWKWRWVPAALLAALLVVMLGGCRGVTNELATTPESVSDGAPFGIDLRRMPAGRTPETILPQIAGAFVREGVRGDRTQGQADYRSGSAVFRVAVSYTDSSASAQTAVAQCAQHLAARGDAAVSQRLDVQPAYVVADQVMCWNRGRYFFSVEPAFHTDHGTFALLMHSLPF